MRRTTLFTFATSALMTSILPFTMVGCAGAPQQSQTIPQDAQAQPQAASTGITTQQMEQLLGRLDALENENANLLAIERQRDLEAIDARRAQQEAQRLAQAIADGSAPSEGATNAEVITPTTGNNTTTQQPAGVPTGISEEQLLEAIIDQLMAGDDPANVRALKAAALSVMTDRHELDYRLLDELNPQQREQVTRFHQMLAVLYEELAAEDSREISRREMIERIDEAIGQLPLKIAVSELCRSVDGYGIYNPFTSHRFLAGRPMRMVVYVELENFHHHEQSNGTYEVKLLQEIEVYDSTGEVRVWRQAPVEITDVSRNRRRDFYIVQPIQLPATLAAGGYRMKIRVIDQHTGSRSETTISDLEVVADPALINP